MSYFNMVCDSCGREVQGITWVNGMKFCAKCYQETFGNQQKYADMLNKENNELLVNLLAEKDKQITELQKQLAEKEKEISEYIKIVDDLHKQLSDKCDFCDKTKDQDKISFTIEQLEKLKVELHIIHTNGYLKAIDEEIDNQIKELKGEK